MAFGQVARAPFSSCLQREIMPSKYMYSNKVSVGTRQVFSRGHLKTTVNTLSSLCPVCVNGIEGINHSRLMSEEKNAKLKRLQEQAAMMRESKKA